MTKVSIPRNSRFPTFFVIVVCCIFYCPSAAFQVGSTSGTKKFSYLAITSTSLPAENMKWTSLDTLRETVDPSNLCSATEDHAKLAKDTEYADAVLNAWKEDNMSLKDSFTSMGSSFVYHESKDGVNLNGYLVAPFSLIGSGDGENMKKGIQLPAIIFFHTGAGPQDVFLRWQADKLVRELNCVVLIADIISDAEGYAWSDRERYNAARRNVLAVTEECGDVARWKLRRSIAAAIHHLKELDFVQNHNIAALGWCMGGHPILELGLMQSGIKALVSYHGVFDGVKDYETVDNSIKPGSPNIDGNLQVLICNGKDDPFVEQDDIDKTKQLLERNNCKVQILNFDKVRHGFTNPAQDFNPSDAFAFDEYAAKKSWESTIHLLRRALY